MQSRDEPADAASSPPRNVAGLTRRQLLRGSAGIGAAGVLLAAGAAVGSRGCGHVAPAAPPQVGPSTFSLLAVGDTGRPTYGLGGWAPAWRVASAMTAAHRRRPCDGLVFLGDNFYPVGLVKERMVKQLRENLVEPYRAFLELSHAGAEKLALERECAACNAVPLYAVMGNHDYATPGSARLELREVSDLVPNWKMARGPAELHELPEGVSLILIQSILWDEHAVDKVAECLARSRGPFRILAAHYPMADPGNNYHRTYIHDLQRVLAKTGVGVHVFLSGHEHNLQLLRMGPPAPPLHVIAGGGSYVRRISDTRARRVFAAATLGFARLDRRSIGGRQVLDVTLYEAEFFPWLRPVPRLLARAWVDADGAVQARVGT